MNEFSVVGIVARSLVSTAAPSTQSSLEIR